MRTATVLISGLPEGQNIRDIEVQPATTAGDVLRALNLTGYLLSEEGSNQHLAAEEDIYNAIPIDGACKFRATPIAEVGLVWWDKLLFYLGIRRARSVNHFTPVPPTVLVRSRQVSSLPAPPPRGSRGIRVERDRRPLRELRGWRKKGKKLIGAFRTPRGSMVGEISMAKIHRPEFFVINPPKSLLSGDHSACFRRRGGGKYYVHFGIHSPEVDAGILAVERLLAQALGVGS